MSLLIFTLLTTALAMPAPDCPPNPPTVCGEGMTLCPGDTQPNGCPMPEICVAEGAECPFFCPYIFEELHCPDELPSYCEGPLDAMGCKGPQYCTKVDWAAGESCPFVCPPHPPPYCGEGMIATSWNVIDSKGCQIPEICVAEEPPCPPHEPRNCGEGMTSCPGDFDTHGCPMPDICVAEGATCPFVCPPLKNPNCGSVLSNCRGPLDAMGCEGNMTCVLVDWAAGESCPFVCPPHPPTNCGEGMRACSGDTDSKGCQMSDICVAEGESCPFFCPHHPSRDCGEGMKSCPGDTDPMGCPMPEICVAEGDECPFFCPHVKHPHCGFAMSYCASPVDEMGCETPMNCIMVDWAAGEQCPPPAEAVAANCGPWTIADCGDGKGVKSCPGELDARGCPGPDICVAEEDADPMKCVGF